MVQQKLNDVIDKEPDIVKAHWLYHEYETSMADDTTNAYTAAYLNITMADSNLSGISNKEPRPNNLEQAEKFREETNKALLTFIDELQSFDRYKAEAAYKYFIHKYLNELLKTDNAYYKNTSIYPVLETIDEKFCKVMFEPDEEQTQMTPHQAQSPDDIEDGEKFIHKLKEVKEF